MKLTKPIVIAFNFLVMTISCHAYTRYYDEINPLSSLYDYASTFDLSTGMAQVQVNKNDTLLYYEGLYKNTTNECFKSCYVYFSRIIDISFSLKCSSKYNELNKKYQQSKPCLFENPKIQYVMDYGNSYYDLFCSVDEQNVPCKFIAEIDNMQKNTTLIDSSCAKKTNQTMCEKSLIENLSIIINSKNQKDYVSKPSYEKNGEFIEFSAPNYNVTLIETKMKNATCITEMKYPEKPVNNTKTENVEKESSADRLYRSINTILLLIVFLYITF